MDETQKILTLLHDHFRQLNRYNFEKAIFYQNVMNENVKGEDKDEQEKLMRTYFDIADTYLSVYEYIKKFI